VHLSKHCATFVKASLTTTLKILYTDFHQGHEARFKQQDPPIVVDNNNHTNDESPSSIAERDVGNCLVIQLMKLSLFPMTSLMLITKSAQQ
jgi:hypothetical protein